MKYPMQHRIIQPARPYKPSYDTDISKTIKAEQKRLADSQTVHIIGEGYGLVTKAQLLSIVTPDRKAVK